MINDSDNEYSRWALTSQFVRGRYRRSDNAILPLSRDEFRRSAVGKSWLNALEILEDNAEAADAMSRLLIGSLARNDKWDQQIYALQDQVKKLEAGQKLTPAEKDALKTKINSLSQSLEEAYNN